MRKRDRWGNYCPWRNWRHLPMTEENHDVSRDSQSLELDLNQGLWIREQEYWTFDSDTRFLASETNNPNVAQCICTRAKQLDGRRWNHGSSLGRGNRCCYSPTRPDWPQLQPSVLFSVYPDRVSSSGSRGVKLNTYFHWVPKFRTSGAISPLPNIPSFVHRDNFLSLQPCKQKRCWCNESANLTYP
jgi:hypothetical protein